MAADVIIIESSMRRKRVSGPKANARKETAQPASPKESDFIRALARGLDVLECFDVNSQYLSLSEVAVRVKLSRGSTRRLLLTLERLGYVGRQDTKFHLRPRTLKLGYGYLSGIPVWEAARNYMKDITAQTGESCSIAVLDDAEIVYVAREPGRRIISDYIAVGTRYPAYATSMGKVLLAALSEEKLKAYFQSAKLAAVTRYTVVDRSILKGELELIRARGYALSNQEYEVGLRSISVPIIGKAGETVAAMNVAGAVPRVSMEDLQTFLPILKATAKSISELIISR